MGHCVKCDEVTPYGSDTCEPCLGGVPFCEDCGKRLVQTDIVSYRLGGAPDGSFPRCCEDCAEQPICAARGAWPHSHDCAGRYQEAE